jgi:uncharacterized cupin superfamily protein
MTRQVDIATTQLESYDLEPGDVVEGNPTTAEIGFTTINGVEVGIWEITPGTVRDTEKDEAFVVLSGQATITFADGEVVEVGPGALVRLDAGEETVWTIHSTLRKVYIA